MNLTTSSGLWLAARFASSWVTSVVPMLVNVSVSLSLTLGTVPNKPHRVRRVARAPVCVAIGDHVHLHHQRGVTREGDGKVIPRFLTMPKRGTSSCPGALQTTSYPSSSHTIHYLDLPTVFSFSTATGRYFRTKKLGFFGFYFYHMFNTT